VILFLKVLGGIVALGLGIYLGGGSYNQSPEEIEMRLGKGQPRKVKRHFMWLNYMKANPRASELRRGREHFKTAVAKDRRDQPPRD